MGGRTGTLVLASLTKGADPRRDAFSTEVASQLSTIGIKVEIQYFDTPWAEMLDHRASVDLFNGNIDTDYPDPVSLMWLLRERSFLPEAAIAELDAIGPLAGQERIDAATAFAQKVSDEQYLVVPTGYPVFPLYLGPKVGCGFVQPAIGAVDLLSLCRKP